MYLGILNSSIVVVIKWVFGVYSSTPFTSSEIPLTPPDKIGTNSENSPAGSFVRAGPSLEESFILFGGPPNVENGTTGAGRGGFV
jgi:hypothetical protein